MKKLLTLAVLALLISCGTANLSFDTMRPADITLPQHMVKLGVVNRSLPAEGQLLGNVLEGVLTGEGIGEDRRGSQFCVEGLVNFLGSSPRFQTVLVNDPELKGTGRDEFAPPIPWAKIQEVCENYGLDGLIVLESFDSDGLTTVGEPVKKTKRVDDRPVTYFEYTARLVMTVRSGWRIYDNVEKRIVDEKIYTDDKVFTAKGTSEAAAIGGLVNRRNATKESGLHAGERFGFRVSPMWVPVTRAYYTGKHDDLKSSKRYVRGGNFEEAIELWRPLVDHTDPKISGRACFNMAMANEYKGNLEEAISWAKKSAKKGFKPAPNYVNILQRRINDQLKLEQQLTN